MEPSKNRGNPWSYQVDASAASNQAPQQDLTPKGNDLHRSLPQLSEVERLQGLLQTIGICSDVQRPNYDQLLHNSFVPPEAKQRWEHYATKAIEVVHREENKLSELSLVDKQAYITGMIVEELNPYFDAEDRRIVTGATPNGNISISLVNVVERFVLTDGVLHSPIYQVQGNDVGQGRGNAVYDALTKSALVARAPFARDAEALGVNDVETKTILQQLLTRVMLEEGCHGLDNRRIESTCGYPFYRSNFNNYAEIRNHLLKGNALTETLFRDPLTLSSEQRTVFSHTMLELSASLFIGSYWRPNPILNHWKKRLELFQADLVRKGEIDFNSKENCYGFIAIIGTHECGKVAGFTSAGALDLRKPATLTMLGDVARALCDYATRDPVSMSTIFEAVRLSHFNAPPRSHYRLQRVSPVEASK